MAGKFCFGAVIKWNGFKFEDGETSNKLLVILGAKSNQNILAVLTTSNPRQRDKMYGCQPDYKHGAFYFIQGGMKNSFREHTWVELYRPQEIDVSKYKKAENDGHIHIVFNLMPEAAAGIRNCLKRIDDVSAHHVSLME